MNKIDEIIKSVYREIKIDDVEKENLEKMLEVAIPEAKELNLCMTDERWQGVGVHMVATIRRFKNEEHIPEFESAIVEQVCSEMQELSRKILKAIRNADDNEIDLSEVVLLALHFEAAKNVSAF